MKRRVDIDREAIVRATNAFLDAGGSINEVPFGESGEAKIQLKRHHKSKERATYVSGKKGEYNE